MPDTMEMIQQCEQRIEESLWSFEVNGDLEGALEAYRDVQRQLEALQLSPQDLAYPNERRVFAYGLMRQANALRQLGQAKQALELGQLEIEAARVCGDEITLARSLLSNGASHILSGEIETGLALLEESRLHFEASADEDHRQGLGWYWILQADLVNANLIPGEPSQVIQAADRALSILEPIENWPGVARAYSARALAYERNGDSHAAEADREAEEHFERKAKSSEGG